MDYIKRVKLMTHFYYPTCGGPNGEGQLKKYTIRSEQDIGENFSRKYSSWTEKWPSILENRIIDAESFWNEYGDKNNYQICVNFPKTDNLFSASLSLLLLPITDKQTLLFNHVCITGDFEKQSNVYITKSVIEIPKKFSTTIKTFEESFSKDETYAFIYISNKEEIDDQLLKKYPWINVKRFSEGVNVFDIIHFLQTGFCYTGTKSNQFMDTVYQKISNYLDSDLWNSANVIIYTSGGDYSECIYDSRLCLNYQRFLKQGKQLSFNVYSTRTLDLYDLVSDTIVKNKEAAKKMKPIWQKQFEESHSCYLEETIEKLNRINTDIENDISSMKKYIYDQSDKKIIDNFQVQYNCCDNSELIETTDKIITPSFYYIKLQGNSTRKKEIIVWTDSCNLYFTENIESELKIENARIRQLLDYFSDEKRNKEDTNPSKDVLEIITAGKENKKEPEKIVDEIALCMRNNKIKFPTKFFLTGLPGVGKTTCLYYIANHFDLEVVSSEIFINYFIFNDTLSKKKRISYKKFWKDVNLHKLYSKTIPFYTQFSRKVFEELANNSEEMKHIREFANRIVLELVDGTDGKVVGDIGGKEALTNVYYDFKQKGYRNIFLTVEGNNDEERFKNYLNFYKEDKNLCNESRRNIKQLALNKKKKIDTESKAFEDSLRKLIFQPRYKYYDRRADYRIIRCQNENIPSTVLKILEALFSECEQE